MKPINSLISWCFGTWTDLSAFVPGEIWPGEAHGTTQGGQCTDARDSQNLLRWFGSGVSKWSYSWKPLDYGEKDNTKDNHGSILVWSLDFENRRRVHVGSHLLLSFWAKQYSLADFDFVVQCLSFASFWLHKYFPLRLRVIPSSLQKADPPWKQKNFVEAAKCLQWLQINANWIKLRPLQVRPTTQFISIYFLAQLAGLGINGLHSGAVHHCRTLLLALREAPFLTK